MQMRAVHCPGLLSLSLAPEWPSGEASASRVTDVMIESRFPWLSHTSGWTSGTPEAALSGVERVSVWTDWPGVSTLGLHETASCISVFGLTGQVSVN